MTDEKKPTILHGTSAYAQILAPRSRLYHGPYGRLCPELPAWSPEGVPPEELDRWFLGFAEDQMIEAPGRRPRQIVECPDLHRELETKFGANVPSGYTYFGQFVDHDITFDPASSLVRQNDPSGLFNFRTPRLDLDSVYGRGPVDQPYLYDPKDRHKFRIGTSSDSNLRDLPRIEGDALIGDPRNDENAIVSQLHLAVLLAHNELVVRAVENNKRKKEKVGDPFEAARRTVRWLYQHIVWNDFIKRVTEPSVHEHALKLVDAGGGRRRWELGFSDVYSWKHQPFMPVEFSVAAYRFGHSMVRNDYQTNFGRGVGVFVPTFDDEKNHPDDLRGFRRIEKKNVPQWNWFLAMSSPEGFPQMARRIDTKLSNALAFVPGGEKKTGFKNVLAARNLKRGWTFGLPAGTAIAKHFGLAPVPSDALELDALWYYVLREAELSTDGDAGGKLGALGSLIVCATFAGLLFGDPSSYFKVEPCWTPDRDPLLKPGKDNQDDAEWSLASLIRIAGLPVTASDFPVPAGRKG